MYSRVGVLSVCALFAGCGGDAGDDFCDACESAQAHMIEKVASNDCNPNYMAEAVDGIVEACGDVESAEGEPLDLEPYRLVGAIHETCQAGGVPLPQCETGVTATVQVRVRVDQEVLDLYPAGVLFSVGYQGDFQEFEISSASEIALPSAMTNVPNGTDIQFRAIDSVGYYVGSTGDALNLAETTETFVIRESAPAFDRFERTVRLSQDADGFVFVVENW